MKKENQIQARSLRRVQRTILLNSYLIVLQYFALEDQGNIFDGLLQQAGEDVNNLLHCICPVGFQKNASRPSFERQKESLCTSLGTCIRLQASPSTTDVSAQHERTMTPLRKTDESGDLAAVDGSKFEI